MHVWINLGKVSHFGYFDPFKLEGNGFERRENDSEVAIVQSCSK